MTDDESELSTAGAAQRLRFAVTAGDVDLVMPRGSGGRTGRETASSVAADVLRFLVGKGAQRLWEDRLLLIMRSPNWRPYLRVDLSSTSRSVLVFGDENPTSESWLWVLCPDRAKVWRLDRVRFANIPKPTGLDLLFLSAARERAGSSATPSHVRDLAIDMARRWALSDLSLDEQMEWAACVDSPDDIAPWSDAGVASPSAREWIRNGFSLEESQPWRAKRLNGLQARVWREAGFDPAEARSWRAQHIEPAAARTFLEAGLGPSLAGPWFAGLRDADLALRWRAEGFTLEQAVAWRAIGPERSAAVRDGREELNSSELLMLNLAGTAAPRPGLGLESTQGIAGVAVTSGKGGLHGETPDTTPSSSPSGGTSPTHDSDRDRQQQRAANHHDETDDRDKQAHADLHDANPSVQLQVDFRALTEAHERAIIENRSLQQANERLSTELSLARDELNKLVRTNEELMAVQVERDDLMRQLAEGDERVVRTEAAVSEALRALDLTRTELVTRDKEHVDMSATLLANRALLLELRSEATVLQAELKVLRAQAQTMISHNDQLNEQIRNLEKTHGETLEVLNAEIAQLREQLRRLESVAPRRILRRASRL